MEAVIEGDGLFPPLFTRSTTLLRASRYQLFCSGLALYLSRGTRVRLLVLFDRASSRIRTENRSLTRRLLFQLELMRHSV